MLAHVRRNAVAYLALFVALGGTSYAAVKLPKNSVGTAQIKNKAVTPAKVSPKAVALFKGATGAQGPKGDKGDKGDPGAQGTPGTAGKDGAPNPNADKLDGFDANGLIRVAHAQETTNTLTGSTTLATVPITAPAAGNLLLIASVDAYNFTADDIATCFLSVDSVAKAETTRELTFHGSVSRDEETDCATNTTVPVAAGAHTVTFSTGAAATTHWNNTTVEAVYIPFNGTGG